MHGTNRLSSNRATRGAMASRIQSPHLGLRLLDIAVEAEVYVKGLLLFNHVPDGSSHHGGQGTNCLDA